MTKTNIFRIVSAADKEMAHSAMVNYILSEGIDDFLNYFGIDVLGNPVKGHLEVSIKYKIKGGYSRKARFDIAFFEESVQDDELDTHQPLMIIENKFKSTPTKKQLEVYDACITDHGINNSRKILMVFLREQIDSVLLQYIESNQWAVIPYISMDSGQRSLYTFLSHDPFQKAFVLNDEVRWIIRCYQQYLLDYSDSIESLSKSPNFPVYDLRNRFVYMQYLLLIQSAIVKKIESSSDVVQFPLENIHVANNGGRSTHPSVSFWMRNENKETRTVFEDSFFSIDGMTPKFGIYYIRAEAGSAEQIATQFFNQISKLPSYEGAHVVPNNRTMIFKNDDQNTGKKSVAAISTFTIKADSSKDEVVSQVADLMIDFFNLMHDHNKE